MAGQYVKQTVFHTKYGLSVVIARLDPATHERCQSGKITWMRGSSPRMTSQSTNGIGITSVPCHGDLPSSTARPSAGFLAKNPSGTNRTESFMLDISG